MRGYFPCQPFSLAAAEIGHILQLRRAAVFSAICITTFASKLASKFASSNVHQKKVSNDL
jgi:hypothetical protein